MIYIMDLDGTLIDSTKRHYVLMEKIIRHEIARGQLSPTVAKMFDAHEFMAFKAGGNSGKSYLTEKLLLSGEDAAGIMKVWGEEIESEEMLALDRLYPDTLSCLKRIANSGNIIIFLTARQREDLVRKQLQDLQILSYAKELFVVDPAHGAEEKCRVVRGILEKMKQEDYVDDIVPRENAERKGFEKENRAIESPEIKNPEKNIIIVGDTENEWQLANELHLPCYLLSRGFRSKTFWDKKGCIAMEDLCRLP